MISPWPLRLHIVFGTLSILIGAAFILGGPARATASAYQTISNLGGPYVWGVGFILVGLATLAGGGHREVFKWSLLVGALAYMMLSLSFLWSALQSPTANYTAMVVYGWISVVQLMMYYNAWTESRANKAGEIVEVYLLTVLRK